MARQTKPAPETTNQRRARLNLYLEREGVTLRQDPREHGDIAEIAEVLQDPERYWCPIRPVSAKEADEVAAWAILRSMRQAAGLSTFFMDYPNPPQYIRGKTASGTLYRGVITTRLDGFDYGVTCQEIVRDCGGTVRQAREALKRLVNEGVAEPMGDGYVLAADVETYCLPIFAGQMEIHRRQATAATAEAPKLRTTELAEARAGERARNKAARDEAKAAENLRNKAARAEARAAERARNKAA